MKMTSAYANKLLKSLADEKSYWTNKEEASRTYVAAVGEEPVIPVSYTHLAKMNEKLKIFLLLFFSNFILRRFVLRRISNVGSCQRRNTH